MDQSAKPALPMSGATLPEAANCPSRVQHGYGGLPVVSDVTVLHIRWHLTIASNGAGTTEFIPRVLAGPHRLT